MDPVTPFNRVSANRKAVGRMMIPLGSALT